MKLQAKLSTSINVAVIYQVGGVTNCALLQAIQLPSNNSAQFTAGNDWTITRSKATDASLYYKDEKEAQRFVDMVEGSDASSTVLRDLAATRHICSQPGFALEVGDARVPRASPSRPHAVHPTRSSARRLSERTRPSNARPLM